MHPLLPPSQKISVALIALEASLRQRVEARGADAHDAHMRAGAAPVHMCMCMRARGQKQRLTGRVPGKK